MSAAEDGQLVYRTPSHIRAAVIALILGDLIVLEAILQTLSVIAAPLQGLIVVLVVVLIAAIAIGLSSFLTVRAGPTWLSVHRLSWKRIDAADVTAVQVLGVSPHLCSIALVGPATRAGRKVALRLGASAMADPKLRAHVAVVVQAVSERGLPLSPAACTALGLHRQHQFLPQPTRSLERVVGTIITASFSFAVSMKYALNDSWGPPIAMGVAVAALTTIFFLWIMGPNRWHTP